MLFFMNIYFKCLRNYYKVSLRTLAKSTKLPVSVIYQYELGNKDIDLVKQKLILDYYNIDITSLTKSGYKERVYYILYDLLTGHPIQFNEDLNSMQDIEFPYYLLCLYAYNYSKDDYDYFIQEVLKNMISDMSKEAIILFSYIGALIAYKTNDLDSLKENIQFLQRYANNYEMEIYYLICLYAYSNHNSYMFNKYFSILNEYEILYTKKEELEVYWHILIMKDDLDEAKQYFMSVSNKKFYALYKANLAVIKLKENNIVEAMEEIVESVNSIMEEYNLMIASLIGIINTSMKNKFLNKMIEVNHRYIHYIKRLYNNKDGRDLCVILMQLAKEKLSFLEKEVVLLLVVKYSKESKLLDECIYYQQCLLDLYNRKVEIND